MTQVGFTSAALAEFAELVAFYDGQGTDLARDFVAEVEQSIERIAEFPDAGAPYESGARRLVLRRFPVVVIYRARESKVEVVALAHQRRRPDYWILREMPPIYSAGAASGEAERIELTMDSTTRRRFGAAACLDVPGDVAGAMSGGVVGSSGLVGAGFGSIRSSP